MPNRSVGANKEAKLRILANERLRGNSAPENAIERASDALRVLHHLASSPASAPEALALLHELQVHQVELELQDENHRNALAELEEALHRQRQLYDFSPAGCFTLDTDTVICEVNVAGAEVLRCARDALVGRTLESFLSAREIDSLRTMMTRVRTDHGRESFSLQFQTDDGTRPTVRGCITVDPTGDRFLVAVIVAPE